MQVARRGFLGGLIGLMAAPAIIRVAQLMPVKAWVEQPAPIVQLPMLGEVVPAAVKSSPVFFNSAKVLLNGIFEVPEIALQVNSNLFQELCLLNGDPTGQYLAPYSSAKFHPDGMLDTRATVLQALRQPDPKQAFQRRRRNVVSEIEYHQWQKKYGES